MTKEKALHMLNMDLPCYDDCPNDRIRCEDCKFQQAIDMAIEALKEMSAEEYRQRLMDVFHSTDHDELLTYVVMPKEEEFKSLEYILQKQPFEPRPHGEWIPCSERLPEIRFDLNSRTSDTVFVCLENRTMHMAFYCDDDVWRFCESGEAKEPMWDKVVAWMPLPEPYKKEGDK